MKIKKIPIILTVLFFAAMIFLTLSARTIHNKMIPNVTVSRLTKEEFENEIVLADGITKMKDTKQLLAIPKELYDRGDIYIIANAEKNGDMRTVAKLIKIEIGIENDGYYEVTNEFFDTKLKFIVNSSEDLQEGGEVYVVK